MKSLGLFLGALTHVCAAEDVVVTSDNSDAAPYAPAVPVEHAYFTTTFQGETDSMWVKSTDAKYAGQPVSVGQGSLAAAFNGDEALVLEKAAQHYGVVAGLTSPTDPDADAFVVQYEVRLHEGLSCGGAYVKLIDAEHYATAEGKTLTNDSPYIVMFGPDHCGATNKVHFIMRHKNPVSGEWEEKHVKSAPAPKIDTNTHLYTLIVRKDNTFSILIDNVEATKGSLLADMDPPVNPSKMIDDPTDSKPETWIDEPKMIDPEDSKPEDWDEDAPKEIVDEEAVIPESWLEAEALFIPDPEALQPEDWDDEEDGEFEAPEIENPLCTSGECGAWSKPMIANPEYKGKWSAKMIENPLYVGEWSPAQIENPHFFEDMNPAKLPSMGAIAVEVWTMTGGMAFDDVYVGASEEEAAMFAEATFVAQQAKEIEDHKNAAANAAKAKRLAHYNDGTFMGKVQCVPNNNNNNNNNNKFYLSFSSTHFYSLSFLSQKVRPRRRDGPLRGEPNHVRSNDSRDDRRPRRRLHLRFVLQRQRGGNWCRRGRCGPGWCCRSDGRRGGWR